MLNWLKSDPPVVERIGNRVEADDLFRHRRRRQRQLLADRWRRRPDPSILNASIPVVFVSRDGDGLWVVRDAVGRRGGVFLFRASAMRFARRFAGDEPAAILLDQVPIGLDAAVAGNSAVAMLRRFGCWLSAFFIRPARNHAIPAAPRVDHLQPGRSPMVKLAR